MEKSIKLPECKKVGRVRGCFYNMLLITLITVAMMAVIGLIGEFYLVNFQGEVDQRAVRPENMKAMWAPDEDIGYVNKALFSYSGEKWWGCDEVLSSHGTRSKEFSEKKNGVYRIVGLGDSVAFGVGVCREKVFLSKLENKLNSRIREMSFEVINASVSGYSAMQEYMFLKKYVLSWKPDMVIITVCPNDLYSSENPFHLDKFIKPSKKIPEGNGLSKPAADDYVPFTTSKFLNFVIEGVKSGFRYFGWVRMNGNYIKSIKDEGDFQYQYFNVINKEPSVMDVYKKIINLCEANNIKLTVVQVPFSTNVNWHFVKEGNRAIELFNKHNVTHIDFLDIFRETMFTRKFLFFYKPDLYLSGDVCHLNEFGHDLVSEKLFDLLKDKVLPAI